MKKLLLILIMLFLAGATYAPGPQRDPLNDIERWLRDSAPLCRENLKLAFDINGIIAPVIVMAQARLETGHFRSELCTWHNNLFGMKKARIRPTTALGATDNDYAVYKSWYDSVKDMKLFQEWYLSRGRDLKDYFGFLASIGYAEDPHYLAKVRELCIISK
jgi:hypothetical protein